MVEEVWNGGEGLVWWLRFGMVWDCYGLGLVWWRFGMVEKVWLV